MADSERKGGVMRVTDTKTLASAMRALSVQIESEDGIANAAIAEAADRLDELAAIALELLKSTRCEQSLPDGCPRCALSARLAALGVMS